MGVAFPANTDLLKGSASCFLPIGSLSTKLPVHVNASFNVLKNRRDIWLPCPLLGNSGDRHVQWAQWNDTLIQFALPQLWKEAIEYLANPTTLPIFANNENIQRKIFAANNEDIQRMIFARLPDLSTIDAQPSAWKKCAENVYVRLRYANVLLHNRYNK